MADEVFALSPISARAALPSEEDYAAISEAFMETARGRWFLTEYAKRNRNADTRMVLDAVARIEQSLAAQKEESLQKEVNLHREENLLQESLAAHQQQAEEAAAAATAARNNLNDALAAMRGAVEAAQQSAAEALDSLALEQRLAPVRKGARVLREIAWRLREIGNDGRICDLIDSQVAVIEIGAEQVSSDEASSRSPGGLCRTRGTAVGVRRRGPYARGRDRGGCALFAGSAGTAPGDDRETVADNLCSRLPKRLYGSKAAPAAGRACGGSESRARGSAEAPTGGRAKSQDAKSQDAKTPRRAKPKTPKLMTRRSST